MENNQHYKLNSYIFLAFIIAFALFLLYSVSNLFTSFLGALMFYILSKPMVEWLIKKKKWNKNLAAVLVIIISFFIVLLPIILIGGLLYKEVSVIANNPEIIIKPIFEFDNLVKEKFNFQLLSAKNLGNIQSFATGIFSSALNVGINFFTSITMMYFFLFFLLTNINRLEAAIILYLPFKKNNIKLFGKELVAQTISNALGVPLIAVIHGILAYIAYTIAGLEQAAFWSIITAVSSVIPIVGTALIWLPVSLFLFIKGETNYGTFIVAWGVIVIGLSDNLIRFLLAKKMADVHPIVTVLGIIIGLKYFGFTGLIFGPLMISYFIILLKIYYNQYQKPMKNKRKQKPSIPSYFHFPLLKGKEK